MKVKIIFPKKFFTEEQTNKLSGCEIEFIEGENIDLENLPGLFSDEEYILVVNPTYLKDNWNALPVERLKRMKGLKALCLTTSSFSWVDTKKLAEMGRIVTNIPGAPTEAVAEFNIYMMFSLLRKLPLIVKNNWKMDYDHFLNEEVKGLTAGIIGLGRIGKRTAELCTGLDMNVCFWNRSKKDSPFAATDLETLFQKSDVVFNTLSTPPEIKGLIGKDLLSKLKGSSIIVSSSDLHVFDVEYVLSQVSLEKLGGFAFESKEKKLSDFEGNVMVFPEQAYYTLGTQLNRAQIVTDTVLSIIEGHPIHRVN